MPVRIRALLAAFFVVAGAFMAASMPAPALGAAPKVVVIVGPVGSLTANYRNRGDAVATAAAAAGATVVKVYSPNATWANVRAAVNGANVIVYFGHGNGFPNPYSSVENTDRVNGWGVNKVAGGGGGGDNETNMVYCGEKALLGTLTGTDGAAQRTYCSGGPITPAPGFVMVYGQAHYAPGFGERYDEEDDPPTTLSEAQQRVRHYSTPVFRLGGGGFFATAYGDADEIVERVLEQPTTSFGDIFAQGHGYSPSTLTKAAHPDISGAAVWVQRTVISGFHFGDPDYWYAFAGNPARTPSGSFVATPRITRLYPGSGSSNASTESVITGTFDIAVTGVSASSFLLRDMFGTTIAADVTYNTYWKRAELRPTQSLAAGTVYTASLTNAIRGLDGGALPWTNWSFTTAGVAPGEGNASYSPAVRLTFRQGTHTGYRFNADGYATASRTMTLGGDSGADTSLRRVIGNQSGRWFYIVNGAWAGYFVRESAGVGLPGGAAAAAAPDSTYSPPVRVTFRQGTHTGYKFTAAGAVTATRTLTLSADSGANTTVRLHKATEYGSFFWIVNGAWEGYWVRESDVVHLP